MNKQSLTLLIGVVIVAIIIAVIAPRMSQDAQNNNDATDTSMVSDIDQPVETTNYAYLLKSEWPYSEQAEEDIQVLGEGQVISNGIVQDPTDRSYYYFASNTIDTEAQTNLVSVYKYNSDDYTFERVYKQTFDAAMTLIEFYGEKLNDTNETAPPTFGIIAYDNGHVVVHIQPYTDTFDCDGIILPAPGVKILSLDLDSPYDALDDAYDSTLAQEALSKHAATCEE